MSSQANNFEVQGGIPSGFLQALAEGMHAMAQPLTIVQGNLEMILFNGITLEDYKQATENSLTSMELGMELLTYVRELVRIYSTPDTVAPLPMAAPIEAAIEDLRPVFDDKRVQVSSGITDRGITVLGSPERIRQAFFYILQAAYACANAGDVVSLRVVRLPDGELAEAELEITAPTGAKLASDDVVGAAPEAKAKNVLAEPVKQQIARSLAMAEAIVVRQHGEFECVRAPFGACLRFPIAHGVNENRIASQFPFQQVSARHSPGAQ